MYLMYMIRTTHIIWRIHMIHMIHINWFESWTSYDLYIPPGCQAGCGAGSWLPSKSSKLSILLSLDQNQTLIGLFYRAPGGQIVRIVVLRKSKSRCLIARTSLKHHWTIIKIRLGRPQFGLKWPWIDPGWFWDRPWIDTKMPRTIIFTVTKRCAVKNWCP